MKSRLVCVLALLVCADALATWARAITFRQMLEWTDSLVRAEVIEKKAVWVHVNFVGDSGTHYDYKAIYTRYRLSVSDVLYGRDSGASVDLYIFGGTIGRESYGSTGSYQLEEGWEVVVPLQWDANRDIFVSAVSAQGVFRAREIGGETLWVNLSDDRDYAGIDSETRGASREHLTLDDWVRPRNGPPVTTGPALQDLFAGVQSLHSMKAPEWYSREIDDSITRFID